MQNGNRGLGVFAKIRFASTKENNNAVRTELLKALGQAFNLAGVGEQIDKLTNKQLENFVVMFCQTGDASGIKDVVDSTIELDAEKGKNSGNGFIDINAI